MAATAASADGVGAGRRPLEAVAALAGQRRSGRLVERDQFAALASGLARAVVTGRLLARPLRGSSSLAVAPRHD